MAKLQSCKKVTIQPDVPILIHDIILTLCQRKYADVSDVEVDGIICISFRGLSEQQVIKIHENLPSPLKALSAGDEGGCTTETEISHKSNDLFLHLEVENVTENEKDKSDHSVEINNHETEPESCRDNEDSNNYRSDISFLSSLLKTTNDIMSKDSGARKKTIKPSGGVKADSKNKVSRRKRKNPIHHPVDSPKKAHTDESLTESNDFSNENFKPAMVIVKQEPVDEETIPKIVDVFSACAESTFKKAQISSVVSNQRPGSGTEQNEYIDYNERQNQESLDTDLGMRRSASNERQGSIPESNSNSEPNEENMNIIIKQEKMDDDEYVAACGEINEDITRHDGETVASGFNHHQIPDYFHITDYLSEENSSSDSKRSPASTRKSNSKAKKDNAASKTWFETVKKNMNRYQAALLKSVQINKKGPEDSRREAVDGRHLNAQKAVNSEETSMLKSILEASKVTEHPERDSSPAPNILIKKETFEDFETEGQTSGDTQPKLVTKYPALFNQLQKAREAENQSDMNSQPDSLLNRLPFLSFKDLFAQAAPSGSASGVDIRPSPERIASLLSQPSRQGTSQLEEKPFHNAVHSLTATTPKRTWNWKKRAVRPKGPNGEILSNFPPQLPHTSEKPVGIANPKRQKSKSRDEDKDWRPHHASEDVGSEGRANIATRSSSGRARRTNFTEVSDSDIEEIELEEDEYSEADAEDQIEIVSAYCKFNCGMRFESVTELHAHEETCRDNSREFKCEYCGLDFNQQYRWQYHMIKVHGISVHSGMFR